MNQPHGYRFDARSRQSARRTTEPGPTGVCIYTQCRECVCDHDGVGPTCLGGFRDKSNCSNGRGELHPQRAFSSLPRFCYYLCRKSWVSTIFDPAVLHVGAGDVQFVCCQTFGVLEDPDHLDVLGDRVTEDIGDDRRVVFPELRKLVGDESPHADVLEADRVDHPAGRFAHARCRRAGHRLERKPFYDDSAEPVEIHQFGEFDPVAEGATGRNYWVFEGKATDSDSEVNPRGTDGDAYPLGRTHWHQSNMAVKVSFLDPRFRRCEPAAVCARMRHPMRVVEKRQLLSPEEIGRTLQRLAHEIVEKSSGTKDLALIGVRRRGITLAERLAKLIRGFSQVDVPVGTLDIALYRDDLSTISSHPLLQGTEIAFPVDDRELVIVDDVLYTGRTIRAAINALFDLGRPKRIRLCVLIDRGHRELPIEASFVGRSVQTTDTEVVEVRLQEIDAEERVVLVDRVD